MFIGCKQKSYLANQLRYKIYSLTLSLFLCIEIAYRFHEESKFEAYDIGI